MLIIKIKNDGTGDVVKGNYDWEVWVNPNIIDAGRVEGHYRKDGWEQLLRRIAGVSEDAKYNAFYLLADEFVGEQLSPFEPT